MDLLHFGSDTVTLVEGTDVVILSAESLALRKPGSIATLIYIGTENGDDTFLLAGDLEAL